MYKYNQIVKANKSFFAVASTLALALAIGIANINAISSGTSRAAGGVSADTSICNTTDAVAQYNVTMPAGTVKSKVNPEFSVTGANICGIAFNVRFVATSRAYRYVGNTLTEATDLRGYPRIETTREIVVKPGAMSIRVKLGEHPVSEVIQMRTEIKMYHSNSFNADGTLKADATPIATDIAGWTQTNFVTF